MIPPPPRSTLFPYTTLFRSKVIKKVVPSASFDSKDISPFNKSKYLKTMFSPKPVPSIFVTLPALKNRVNRSEEHTSELQSRPHLVCRLLLEKKKKTTNTIIT